VCDFHNFKGNTANCQFTIFEIHNTPKSMS